ncbi:hypothetical protein [Bosea caraganae]|uniref:hypothetical protein n=1 Tax=Bosea caraganae TaxID=2763117 RepID=UPI0011C028BD|nr:hypothetical protein [Bosea caraganae]
MYMLIVELLDWLRSPVKRKAVLRHDCALGPWAGAAESDLQDGVLYRMRHPAGMRRDNRTSAGPLRLESTARTFGIEVDHALILSDRTDL